MAHYGNNSITTLQIYMAHYDTCNNSVPTLHIYMTHYGNNSVPTLPRMFSQYQYTRCPQEQFNMVLFLAG